ncbi:MlaD family protein [Aurantibacillus circumpalustris]|uniref:MlaD family protein n=1 Tax=Aurantibacillus circumpalustris TaxID=3036359 RepID=UPI00295B121D|nr:MlaD family protein [Aurantibacillus circumpalustris]
MKKETTNSLKLGVFVSVTIALLMGGMYYIGKRQQLFGSTFELTAVFKDIGGLQVGNNIRFSGINVGVVNDIVQTTDTTVKVTMLINDDTRKFIKKNAKAIVGSDGLMGNKIVVITPGTPGKIQVVDKDVIETSQPVNMDDILFKIKVTADNAAWITENLGIVMENIKDGKGTLGKILMDSTFAENVDAAMVNIQKGAGGFKKNMDAASHNILLRGFFKKKKKDNKN